MSETPPTRLEREARIEELNQNLLDLLVRQVRLEREFTSLEDFINSALTDEAAELKETVGSDLTPEQVRKAIWDDNMRLLAEEMTKTTLEYGSLGISPAEFLNTFGSLKSKAKVLVSKENDDLITTDDEEPPFSESTGS